MKISKNDKWIIGGKNVDEDPHFSLFYLKPTAYDEKGYCNYGEVISCYQGYNEVYFVKKGIAEKISKSLLKKMKEDEAFMEKVILQIEELSDKIFSFVEKNQNFIHDYQRYSYEDVLALYQEHNRLTSNLYTWARIPGALDRGVAYFSNHLMGYLHDKKVKDCQVTFTILTTPEKPTELFKSAIYFEDIINKIKESKDCAKALLLYSEGKQKNLPKEVRERIKEYLRKWGHLDYHGYSNRRIQNLKTITKRICNRLHSNKSFKLRGQFDERIKYIRRKKKEIIEKYSISDTYQYLFSVYGNLGVNKIYRRSAQLRNFMLLDKIIEYLSYRFNEKEEVFRFMLHEEIENILIKRRLPKNIFEFKKRFVKSLYYFEEKKIEIITKEDEIDKVMKDIKIRITKMKKLQGISVSRGRVRGRVRILTRSNKGNFHKGDILVCEAADPDLLPEMLKSSAIVTEQGGVTSHACIIARELRKPCIVGIPNLLDHVSDGSLVEVNADDGKVKILD